MTKTAAPPPYNEAMKVLYADSLFALSLLTDYLLCLATGRLCALVLRRGRYFAAALLGAVYAVAVFLPGLAFLALPVMQLVFAGLMGLIAFGGEARLGRCLLVFLALSATFGGMVWAVCLRRGGVLGPDLALLLAVFLACYAVLSLLARGRRRREEARIVRAALSLGGRRTTFRVLLDTGNCLTDPVTGAAVLVVAPEALAPLVPEQAALLTLRDPVELIGRCGPTKVDWKNRVGELGIVIAGRWRGQGYGSEAMVLLCGFCFGEMNLRKLKVAVLASNKAALRCYEANGFRREGTLRGEVFRGGRYVDVELLARFAEADMTEE